MPLQISVNPNYIGVTKIPINSAEKNNKEDSNFDYDIDLPFSQELQRVLGIELVGHNFKFNMVPSFYPRNVQKHILGRNILDFTLENPDISATPGVFSITYPTLFFVYTATATIRADYLEQSQSLVTEAIQANPTWRDKVRILFVPEGNKRTVIVVQTIDPLLPAGSTTKMTLKFLTGPNEKSSPHQAMGFPKEDIESDNTTFTLPIPEDQVLLSPNQTNLSPFRYVDIIVKNSQFKPLARVYFQSGRYSVPYIDPWVTRVRLQNSDPIKKLKTIEIRLEFEGGFTPGDYGVLDFNGEHDLLLHFFTLETEIQRIPEWINQNFYV